MLQIVNKDYCPDDTYFRTGDVEPDLEGNTLTLYTGTGTRRSSWGAPGVTTTLVVQQEDLVVAHIGFYHKHGGSQFWRYFLQDDEGLWSRVTWRQLNDTLRTVVLDAYTTLRALPSWAKEPGKLTDTYKKPHLKTTTTYKLVQVRDGLLYSVHSPNEQYILGKRKQQRAEEDHRGGYYSYPSSKRVKSLFWEGELFGKNAYQHPMTLALVEVEIAGTQIGYDNGKISSTYLTPVRVLETFSYVTLAESREQGA